MAPFIRRYAPEQRAAKYPVLLLLHGCAGDFPHLDHWARLLAAEGCHVYTIDSLTPRGIRPWQAHCLICTGLYLQGLERSRDISAALSLICRDNEADLTRLGIIGWSHGAWTVMEWLHDATRTHLSEGVVAQPAALIFVYPYCGTASVIHQQSWPSTAPVLIFIAERDKTVSNVPTRHLAENLEHLGVPVSLITMPGAKHAFDLFYKKSFDPEQTLNLKSRVLHFLGQRLSADQGVDPSSGQV